MEGWQLGLGKTHTGLILGCTHAIYAIIQVAVATLL